jgi:hypothetical protein
MCHIKDAAVLLHHKAMPTTSSKGLPAPAALGPGPTATLRAPLLAPLGLGQQGGHH